jgi:enoyl-CoA hydratase
MPEVGIGFFPDVGATFVLPRLPGKLGSYCALTGERFDAADGVAAGVATHRVPSARFADVIEALCRGDPVEAALAGHARDPGRGSLAARSTAIAALFAGERVEDILVALDAAAAAGGVDTAFACASAALMRTKSPTSLKIALAQMQHGRALDFAECMRTEFRIVSRVVRGHDFYEGVRAVIIDKDQAPRWEPPALTAVSAAEVERHFAPLASELELP